MGTIDTLTEQIRDTERNLADKRSKLELDERKAEEYKNAARPYTNEELQNAVSSAVPNVEDKKVLEHLEKIRQALMKLERMCMADGIKDPLDTQRTTDAILNALKSPSYKERLDELSRSAMSKASIVRDERKMAAFSAILEIVSLINKLLAIATRSISTQAKKEASQMSKKLKEYNKYTENVGKTLEKRREEIRELENTLNSQRQAQSNAERKARAAKDAAESNKREIERREEESGFIVKDRAKSHRSIFEGGINSVQTTDEIAELMNTDLKQMSPSEKQQILTFIRTNASVFRQTLRRKYASHEKRQVDVRATVKAASKSGGEPIGIKYKKPVKSHAKVVILTDISGSCRRTATLALYFMAMMDEAFPGGCSKYAFVNNLNSVDQYFRDKTPDDGIEILLTKIPTRGVYSDYGRTIHQFRQQCGGAIHQDTTVIILGDARNNSRRSYAEDIKYISDRCRKVFWLNSDEPAKWNTGDSIIGEYERAGAEAHYVQTVGDLLQFLTDVH